MNKLDGKIALVTGASRGLGRGIALGFAREGAKCVITARSNEPLERLAREIESLGVEVLAVPADLSNEDAIRDVFARTLERFGRLDLLVNNAAAFDGGPLWKLPTETIDKVLNINFRSPFLCTREAMAIMVKQRSGRIINIGSISAQMPRDAHAPYTATKFAIEGLSRCTALEGRPHGVTCCAIHPGNIGVEHRLKMEEGKEHPEPMMAVDDVVAVALLAASLPDHVCLLDSIILPAEQLYVGRG